MSVEDVLKRKITLYKANGQDAAAANAQQALNTGIGALLAVRGATKPRASGTGNRLRLLDLPTKEERALSDNAVTRFNVNSGRDILLRMAADPVYAAQIEHELRKPRKVDKFRHGLSGRIAAREPILNADPQSIRNGLEYREPMAKNRMIVSGVYKTLVVKPRSMAAAKLEHAGTFWGERTWNVHTLRYQRGFCVITDRGSQSKMFHDYGSLRKAILADWELVR